MFEESNHSIDTLRDTSGGDVEAENVSGYRYRPPGQRRITGGERAISALPGLLQEVGVTRAILVTSPALVREGALLDRVRSILGDACVGVFSEVVPHSPLGVVGRCVAFAADLAVDGVVSLGGGSSIDTAKGVVWYRDEQAVEPALPHIAIPSTFSGAEFTPDAGITVEGIGKRVHSHERLIPHAVILGPSVPGTAPIGILGLSLLNALAHCLEGLVSIKASPMSDAFYLHAVRLLREASFDLSTSDSLAGAQAGAALAAMHELPAGLAHALAHVVGGRSRLSHGAIHAIVGPAVMRFNLPVVAGKQRLLGDVLNVVEPGMDDHEASWAAINAVLDWAAEMGVPKGLRTLGVSEDQMAPIVEEVKTDPSYANNPRSIGSDDQIREVLEWCWTGEIPPPGGSQFCS